MRRTDLPPRWAGVLALVLCFCLASCKPKKTEELLRPVQSLGVVLAEEAIGAAGTNKNIALILPDSHWGEPSTLEKALQAELQARGCVTVVARAAYLGSSMAMSRVGLQPSDFYEALQSATNAGAIISIAGAPLLTSPGANPIETTHPPVLVVATASLGQEPGLPGNRARLASLLEAKIIQLAVIDGAEEGTASSARADDAKRLFAQNYRILRAPR